MNLIKELWVIIIFLIGQLINIFSQDLADQFYKQFLPKSA